jgi:hypothetical protein
MAVVTTPDTSGLQSGLVGDRSWMDAVFLLGAGASVDGGLPTSVELTARLVAALRRQVHPSMPPEVEAKVLAALDVMMGILGPDADFESLGAAAKALADRE